MDAESFYSLLFNLYAEQESLKIEYELDNSFFSTDGFQTQYLIWQVLKARQGQQAQTV